MKWRPGFDHLKKNKDSIKLIGFKTVAESCVVKFKKTAKKCITHRQLEF